MDQCLGCCFWQFYFFRVSVWNDRLSHKQGRGSPRSLEDLGNNRCIIGNWGQEIEREGPAVYLFLLTPGYQLVSVSPCAIQKTTPLLPGGICLLLLRSTLGNRGWDNLRTLQNEHSFFLCQLTLLLPWPISLVDAELPSGPATCRLPDSELAQTQHLAA